MDRVGHPALLLVDTISSLGSVDYRHDEWKVDVTVSGSQKGLMLPPGLGFNAISEKARAAARTNRMPRSYWDWEEMLKPNAAASSPTRRPQTCSTACARRLRCCLRKGWRRCSAATSV
jgi:alanine-glyoxylate transaminase/serine-glyoxylate transaminase/serine-pyruvate transaminase